MIIIKAQHSLRRFILIFFTMALIFRYPVPAAGSQAPLVSADAAILMDVRTGQVLAAKNAFKLRPPASTTKVMTAILAIEMGNLDDVVTVSRKAARTEGSSIYLKEGEKLKLSDLLYGALLKSGNDACVAIAEHIAGSTDDFAVLMNAKALALGTVNTNFVNPNGLPDKNHYTTAYDLALIGRYALANPVFAEIVSTKDTVIDWPGNTWDRKLKNTNKLLWRYLWADGVKTGTTNAAGQCLVSSASKDNRQLIAVVLHSGNRWADSIRLFEYGFGNFEYAQVAVTGEEFNTIQVQNGSQESMRVIYGSDLGILIPVNNPQTLEKRIVMEPYPTAPIKQGQTLGVISYYVDNVLAGKVRLISAEDVEQKNFLDFLINWLKMKLDVVLDNIF